MSESNGRGIVLNDPFKTQLPDKLKIVRVKL